VSIKINSQIKKIPNGFLIKKPGQLTKEKTIVALP